MAGQLTTDSTLLDQLAEFDTPTICNAVELYDVRSPAAGFMDRRIQCAFPELPPMVGYAATATYRAGFAPDADGLPCDMAELLESFARLPGPAAVVIQDLDEPSAAACFGDVSCSTYQAFGARGLVTSGAGRDMDQVRGLGFPAFSDGAICAHGFTYLASIGGPVQVGGLTVRPGDLLHGDRNGVTLIPASIADRVADVARALLEAEKDIVGYVQATSPPTISGYREAVASMNQKIDEIRARIAERTAA